jgi:hypothetical protein
VIGVVVQQQNIRDHKVEGPELAGIARLEAERVNGWFVIGLMIGFPLRVVIGT